MNVDASIRRFQLIWNIVGMEFEIRSLCKKRKRKLNQTS